MDGWMPPHPGDEGIMGSGGGEAAAGTCWLSRCLVTKHILALGGVRLYSTWRSASNATPPRSQISPFIIFVGMVIIIVIKPDVPMGMGGISAVAFLNRMAEITRRANNTFKVHR